MDIITQKLFELEDIEYKNFQSPLLPTVDPQKMIGVRTPDLRRLAKEFYKRSESKDFLKELPHIYFEENNLHAFLIENIKDIDECLTATDNFLPYVDNWTTCDCMRPKVFKKDKNKLLDYIFKWLKSDEIYAVRFAVEMLMIHFLDEDFSEEYPKLVASINSDEYYINMMIAWYFATALAKQWNCVVPYFENKMLPKFVHNKTIQKAVESFRITNEQKEYLKKLKIK